MSHNTNQDLPARITSKVPDKIIETLAKIINDIEVTSSTQVVSIINQDLFNIINDIVHDVVNHNPDIYILVIRDVLEKVTYNVGDDFLPVTGTLSPGSNDLIVPYTMLIDLDRIKNPNGKQKVNSWNEKVNVLILQNDQNNSNPQKITSNRIMLKANLLISRDKSVLKNDSLIVTFPDSNVIHLLNRELIDNHPGSLFDLKRNFNNGVSNVLCLNEIDPTNYDIVVKGMNSDLAVFEENRALMDFLGLKLNPLISTVVSSMSIEIDKEKDESNKKIEAIRLKYRNRANEISTLLTKNGPECVFVDSIQLYNNIVNCLNNNTKTKTNPMHTQNIVPIQLSYVSFNCEENMDEDRGTGSISTKVSKATMLLNFSVMDGAPLYINFCDTFSQAVDYSRQKLGPSINSYESLRRAVISQAVKKEYVGRIKKINLSGNSKVYIKKLADMCDLLVELALTDRMSDSYYSKLNTDATLDVELLEKIYKKIASLNIKDYGRYFSKYIGKLEPVHVKQIDETCEPADYNHLNYSIKVVSYFGFLKL